MRMLKRKIALAKAIRDKLEEKKKAQNNNKESRTKSPISSPRKQHLHGETSSAQTSASEPSRAIKNIVKNYGRAICTFASSELARPYLINLTEKEGVEMVDFIQYTQTMKSKIDGLFSFRSLLLKESQEDLTTVAFKKLFQAISEIFIKYYSVNWIFHSKVHYKQAHLNFRFKILRRIQNPEMFTYLQQDRRKINKTNK